MTKWFLESPLYFLLRSCVRYIECREHHKFFNSSGTLHIKPKWANIVLKRINNISSSLALISSLFTDVVFSSAFPEHNTHNGFHYMLCHSQYKAILSGSISFFEKSLYRKCSQTDRLFKWLGGVRVGLEVKAMKRYSTYLLSSLLSITEHTFALFYRRKKNLLFLASFRGLILMSRSWSMFGSTAWMYPTWAGMGNSDMLRYILTGTLITVHFYKAA